jgi:DNA polymerase III subunit epsilon
MTRPLPPLAFIDVETTGLDPAVDRIAEIGVVLVDGGASAEWSCLLALGAARLAEVRVAGAAEPERAPSFTEIASELAARLSGRLLVAHNARFDYAFLKAEYQRSGRVFEADVLCSLALSRRLYPQQRRHDLDSLQLRHALPVDVRHRALPDARLLARYWQVMLREHPPDAVAEAIVAVREAPTLPPQLDPSLLARLPDAPGMYAFHGDGAAVLHAGVGGNLRLQVTRYFRIDRASPAALSVACRVRDITWRVTAGPIGARLQLAAFERVAQPSTRVARRCDLVSWTFAPDASPCVALVPASAPPAAGEERFGFFTSERKAHNALRRLTTRLGLPDELPARRTIKAATGHVVAVPAREEAPQRLRRVMRIYDAMREWRIARWPYEGPVGVRERRQLHVFDEWCHLGTARDASEVPEILASGPRVFDRMVYDLLTRVLARIPAHRIVRLARADLRDVTREDDWQRHPVADDA